MSLRALLVEDNPGDAELVMERLGESAVDITHVARLDEAMAELHATSFDAVLLDLGLPDSKGIGGVRKLLHAHPDLVIVVHTGLQDEETGTAAVQAGAQDFLSKGSYNASGLVKALAYAVERSRWQRQLRELVEKNVDAMVVVGVDSGVVQHVNPAAEKLFGRGAHDLVGHAFPYPLEDQSTSEIEIPRGDPRDSRFAQMRVAQIEWAGENAYLASLRDVTDLRRSQELERRLLHADRLASIGQLAAGVAHEINNPSAFIHSNLELLAERIETLRGAHPELADLLEEMAVMLADSLAGAKRISAIVGDLSSFSRIERDEVDAVDVNDVIEVACSIAHNEIRHRARLVKKLGNVPTIAADRPKLIQVVINLLVNAAHAIEGGHAEQHSITVSTFVRDACVVIAVEDTGCGIPAHQLRRIFEPFFTTKEREVGTGLGLSISAETIRRHRGELEVTSVVGQGTRFEVILPEHTGLSSAAPQAPSAELSREVRDAGRRARVLLIDDEALIRRAVRRILEPAHSVVEAPTGQDALDVLARSEPFDVIICDLMMPELDGPTFYERVGALHPALLDRLVFLTGGAFTPRAKEFLSSTHPLVLEKPISKSELLRVVKRIALGE